MYVDRIREIVLLLDETSLAELEFEGPEFRLSLRKGSDRPGDRSSKKSRKTAKSDRKFKEEEPDQDLIPVISPMVGTFYRSPSPDSPPFVEVGVWLRRGRPSVLSKP